MMISLIWLELILFFKFSISSESFSDSTCFEKCDDYYHVLHENEDADDLFSGCQTGCLLAYKRIVELNNDA